MINLFRFSLFTATLLVCFASYAAGNAANDSGGIEVTGAWTRATVTGQDAAGVDLTITSKHAARLVGVSSPAAKTVELHRMTSENGMMKMREVKTIELPAGKRVNLHGGGYHLMLTGLKAPLKEGDTLSLTLNIKVSNKPMVKIQTRATVKSLTGTSAAVKDDGHLRDH